jgi:hypothetical protein
MMITKVSDAINYFAKASDRGYTSALETILHPAFRVIVVDSSTNETSSTFDRSQYLSRVRERIVGAADRTVDILTNSFCSGFASVPAALSHSSLSFSGVYLLINERGQWFVLQEVIRKTDHAT